MFLINRCDRNGCSWPVHDARNECPVSGTTSCSPNDRHGRFSDVPCPASISGRYRTVGFTADMSGKRPLALLVKPHVVCPMPQLRNHDGCVNRGLGKKRPAHSTLERDPRLPHTYPSAAQQAECGTRLRRLDRAPIQHEKKSRALCSSPPSMSDHASPSICRVIYRCSAKNRPGHWMGRTRTHRDCYGQ